MSATIGITNLFGVSAPSGCVVNSSESQDTVEVKTIKNQSGVTVQAAHLLMAETKINTKGKGIPVLSLVAGNSSISAETIVATEISITESNDDFPDFELTSMSWYNL